MSDAYYCKECTIQEKDVRIEFFDHLMCTSYSVMVVQKLSIWVAQRLICSTKGRNMDLKRDENVNNFNYII